MEIFILQNACLESACTLLTSSKEGTELTIRECRSDHDHNYRLTMGSENPAAGSYLKMLISESEKSTCDLLLRMKTDAAAQSNKVDLQVEGFCTQESSMSLWSLGGARPIKLRVSVSMTKFIPLEGKIQVLERGFINTDGMTLSNPQVTGLTFPTSILETCCIPAPTGSAEEHRHYRLSGTLSIALICDSHLPCHAASIVGRLLRNKMFTDVTVVCGGRTLKCHKIFLAAQSPVFAEILQNDKTYAETKTIIIDDFPPEVTAPLLAYFYDGNIAVRVQQDPRLTVELLKASDKYGVADLVEKVKTMILGKGTNWFDVESALQLYLFTRDSDRFSDLKMKAVKTLKEKPGATELTNKELVSRFLNDSKAASELAVLFKTPVESSN